MFIKGNCEHFVCQDDRNGEFAFGICNAMDSEGQDHEGNYDNYMCPLYSPSENNSKLKHCYIEV